MNPEQEAKAKQIQGKANELVSTINELCPNSRERTSAITSVEQSTLWANASLAADPKSEGRLQPDSLEDMARFAGK